MVQILELMGGWLRPRQ